MLTPSNNREHGSSCTHQAEYQGRDQPWPAVQRCPDTACRPSWQLLTTCVAAAAEQLSCRLLLMLLLGLCRMPCSKVGVGSPEHGHVDGALSTHGVKVAGKPHINERPAGPAQLGGLRLTRHSKHVVTHEHCLPGNCFCRKKVGSTRARHEQIC